MAVQTCNYEELAPRVKQVLRNAFPEDTIVISPGYLGRIHVKVVSELFNTMSDCEKQAYIDEVLREHLAEEAQAVSLAIAYGTDEL